jgi:hypothetical protein
VQFKSKTADGRYVDVFFHLGMFNASGGGFYFRSAWGCGYENPAFPLGPYSNSTRAQTCDWFTPLATPVVQTGQWFKLTAQIRPSAGYTGMVKFWVNDVLIYDFENVMTGYPGNWPSGAETQWSVNAYANGLTPSTYTQYVDDASIETSGP